MKILSIVSSYRKNGNTAQVVSLIHEQLDQIAAQHGEPIELETLFIGHMDLQPCRGCRHCFNHGEQHCPIKDDLPAIRAKMQAADGIIFASPVYISDVNGIMKTLLDRLAYVCHRPAFADKCVTFVATTGSSSTRHALRTLGGMITWGVTIVGQKGFMMGARMKPSEVRERFTAQANQVARKLFKAVYEQKVANPSILSLMIFRLLQRNYQQVDPKTVDYRYWQSKGWIDPQCDYYLPHQSNRLSVGAARLASSIMQLFV